MKFYKIVCRDKQRSFVRVTKLKCTISFILLRIHADALHCQEHLVIFCLSQTIGIFPRKKSLFIPFSKHFGSFCTASAPQGLSIYSLFTHHLPAHDPK